MTLPDNFQNNILEILSRIGNDSEPYKLCQYARRMPAFISTFDIIYMAK